MQPGSVQWIQDKGWKKERVQTFSSSPHFHSTVWGKMETDACHLLWRAQWQTRGWFHLSPGWWAREFIGLLTRCAYQSAASNHCIAVENGPGETAGEWCFLCTFSISVGPADGVDGAVEMKTLPCPLAPSVCSLTPMWIKGQCVYTSEGTLTPLQCMSCSHFNLAFSSVQWCSCVNSFTCLTP